MTEETLFHEALAREPAERAAFLGAACAGQPGLRQAVEALLAAHESSSPLLARPADVDATSAGSGAGGRSAPPHQADAPPETWPGTTPTTAAYSPLARPELVVAGRYTLLEKIGEGGMGEVWVARQTEPVKRKVALKLIKPGMDSRAVIQRFEQERQALAVMDHPNIARVLDGGMTAACQPFFVMELVNGLPLNRYCDEARLHPRERLELFVPICQAVQHAHQKGIVHRDLKPANILVTLIDGKPVPKVIDFGVAKATAGKLTDATLSTQFGAVVGTLEYMSPEQAGFAGEDIDTRADIYSLGVILYELLTGLRPLDAERLRKAALTEMIRIIREEEPSKPSTRLSTDASLRSLAALRQTEPRKLMTMLRGELDWVVMKCLEKSRDRRYETANGLARDIQRYLADEAVEARPPSAGYRFGKFVQRNKGRVIAACAVLCALVVGIIGTSIGHVRADQARRAEAAQRQRAEQREQQAIDAVKRFRDAVIDNAELKNNPQLEPLRKTLLKEPLSFFQSLRGRLQADKDTRPESLARLASAAYELGGLTAEIGDKEDALKAYRESLAIWQKLADAHPGVSEFQSSLARSHGLIGELLSVTGHPAEALRSQEAALLRWQKLSHADPTVPEFESALAASYNDIGMELKALGKPAEALKSYELAMEMRRKLAEANPAGTEFQTDLANSYNNIGNLLAKTGKPAEALKFQELALEIRQKLAAANPGVASFLIGLAGSYNNIGTVLSKTGKPAEALQSFELALEIRRKLAEANPSVTTFQIDLAGSYHNVGAVLSDNGKPAEARKSHELALEICRKLADANPTVPEFQSGLARSFQSLGALLTKTGKPVEALKPVELALEIRRKLADANPTVPEFQSELALSYYGIGFLLREAGKPDEALRAHELALKIRQRLADANPSIPQFQSDLATSHIGIGYLLRNAGKPAEALKSVERAQELLQQAADANPTITEFQTALAGSHSNIGQLLEETGNPAEALKAYELALAIRRKLAEANPTVTEFQRDLATSYNNIGNLLRETARPSEALKSYERALEIVQRLADANSTVAAFRHDLAQSQNNIGLLLGEIGRPAEARKASESAVAIRTKLVSENPESPSLASDLGATLNNLAQLDITAKRFDEARTRLREAITWQRKALAAYPAHPTYRLFLSNHLRNMIKAASGLEDAEGGAEAERELAELQRSNPLNAELDARLSAIVKEAAGTEPTENAERLRLAQRAYDTKRHATAARLWGEALASDPRLGDNRQNQCRYNAACAAVLAASGQAQDEPSPAENERAKLRQQASTWLEAELELWTTLLQSATPDQRKFIAATLNHWRNVDPDLAGVREESELANLPEDERFAWQAFWVKVDALLLKARAE
jgi:tetratricopeptide (TPR) repeat protein